MGPQQPDPPVPIPAPFLTLDGKVYPKEQQNTANTHNMCSWEAAAGNGRQLMSCVTVGFGCELDTSL